MLFLGQVAVNKHANSELGQPFQNKTTSDRLLKNYVVSLTQLCKVRSKVPLLEK